RTRPGCEKLIQQAIEECPVPNIQQYIQRNYFKNTDQWALWSWQHSPLLLQVTTTNPLES
ncbi:958_t:CDS:1, partial [Gigaspora rosea]